jgi:YfiH family protein
MGHMKTVNRIPKRGGTEARATAAVNRKKAPQARGFGKEWELRNNAGLQVVEARPFGKLPWLVHGFSTRMGGASALNDEKVLNLTFTDWDTRENVLENRTRFLHALGAADFELVTVKQFHSDVVCAFDSKPGEPCRGDALITNKPELLLAVQTADCVPILLADPKQQAVAAIHAGWRGTLARIVQKTIGQMQMRFGSKPGDLLATLGPAIGGCCYEVGTELVTQFTSQFENAADWFDELRTGEEPNPLQWLNMMPPGHQPPPKKVRLDLRKANRAQLLESGLPAQSVFVGDLCTSCRPDLFFSYRKQGPGSGRLLSAIGLRA